MPPSDYAGFAKALSLLMSKPGARSSDPEFNPPTYTTSPLMNDTNDNLDDLNLSEEDLLQAERMDLVNEINAFILTLPEDTRLGLVGPDTLTVKRMNGVYAKIAHVGGEGFKPLRSFVGKRGKLVICFAPLEAAEYNEMEMYANDCLANLHDFGPTMQFPDGMSLETKLFLLGKKESQLREAARNKGKFDDYDSFGMF